MMRAGIYILFCVLLSCSPRFQIQKEMAEAELKFQDHMGLLVYDPSSRKTLIDYNSSKYFTPASNTKIFTLFSSVQLIGDSIPALRYVERGDSLIFWGTGDPSFLYSEVFQNTNTYDFLKNSKGSLYFSASNFYDDAFGPGWAWDDYNYYYSPERSSFPIYGNCIEVTDSPTDSLRIVPKFFQDSVTVYKSLDGKEQILRATTNNSLSYYAGLDTASFTRLVPFRVSNELIKSLLQDTLKRDVTLVDLSMPKDASVLYSLPSDSLYKVMMQQSDNFIAEQLLQICAEILSDSMKADIAIKYAKEKFLFDLPDEPQWVDGSGLSRYNLFTPRSIVRLWEKIMLMVPQERLFQLLAIGGKAGTIKNSYVADPPYIFGKTGSLSNNHCLSGYLVTKKKKVLIFSFMNNNYTVASREVRAKMESVLFKIHDQY